MSEEALLDLLRVSRRNNRRDDITGLLLYRGGLFMQALEGPEKAVRDVLERVRRDPRHHQMQVLRTAPTEKRNFGHWAMGFRNMGDIPADDSPAFSFFLETPGDEQAFGGDLHLVHRLLLSFKRQLKMELGR